jgi:hypothetical protein
MDGGPLHKKEFLAPGPTPPATIVITDIMGVDDIVYLRTWTRFARGDDTWKYVSSSPNHAIGTPLPYHPFV